MRKRSSLELQIQLGKVGQAAARQNRNVFSWLFLKKIVNWRIIASQYCTGFCHTTTWISHKYTCVPSLLYLLSTSHQNLQTINAGEGVARREPSCTVGGNVNWYSHYGEQLGGSLKTRNKTTIQPRNPPTGQILWENHNWKRHMNLMSLFKLLSCRKYTCKKLQSSTDRSQVPFTSNPPMAALPEYDAIVASSLMFIVYMVATPGNWH